MTPLVRVLPELRRGRPEDYDFIARLSDLVFRRYDPSAVRNVVRMVRNPSAETIVLASGDVRIGFAVLRLKRHIRDYGPWHQPVVAYLDAIAVRPDFSRQGLGAVLLEGIEHLALRHGAVSLSLTTAIDNQPAKRLFHAAGYQLVTSFDDVYAGGRRGLTMMKGLRRESTPPG